MEVHDLDNEKTGSNECQINETIQADHAVIFSPDILEEVHREPKRESKVVLGCMR